MSALEDITIPLLYVRVKEPKTEPLDDELTLAMERLFNSVNNQECRGSYHNGHFTVGLMCLGVHRCFCGEQSHSCDYLIKTTIGNERKMSKAETIEYFQSHGAELEPSITLKVMNKNLPLKYAVNTLCVHYLRYHRHEIPVAELEKVRLIINNLSLV